MRACMCTWVYAIRTLMIDMSINRIIQHHIRHIGQGPQSPNLAAAEKKYI